MYEIRNYHFDPAQFDAYRQWAIDHAVPYLKANLDVVGFWIDNGDAAEYAGREPMTLPLGAANVTWIIRWDSQEARADGYRKAFGSDGWKAVMAQHPDRNGYLQTEARFADAV